MADPEVLWRPSADARAQTRVGAYMDWLAAGHGRRFEGYDDLWRWSTTDLDGFWRSVWEYMEATPQSPGPALTDATMPGARWFPNETLNWAERALRLAARSDGDTLVIGRSQTRARVTLTAAELRDQVARARTGLQRLGVRRGDRVAGYLPNVPEAVIALLATASLGATWTSCAPEFGVRSVVDRFSQVEPRVLLAMDGYRYGDREVDRRGEVAAIREQLPSLNAVVVLPYLDAGGSPPAAAAAWEELVGEPGPLEFERVPFDHPLYILYSSGTTGLPKPIVHGHGGILLEHLKIHALHHDLGAADRFFWFTTTGWMMWNYLASGLLTDTTLVLYDGSPAHPDLGALWRLADEEAVTFFGTSAPFLMACRKEGVVPRELADLSGLRGLGSTGSPLPAEGFRYVYEAVSPTVHLQSVSGGTDVCTAFVGGSPLVPVWEGEISCRHLACAVEAWSADGRPLVGEEGELVITAPMPSMPVGFWNDPDGSRYRAAYFETFPGMWRHGDWITLTERGSCIISGRSDATLNRGGVRIGTAEFYAVVEALPEVADALVLHLDE
ncbi:MAG TPA: acetoacetate--CoA ligase, partial [Candidatus Limnocylindria bacterium]|nr:acetoacetate--CoA ligase [Candidatus Limnocylindria bacterium]